MGKMKNIAIDKAEAEEFDPDSHYMWQGYREVVVRDVNETLSARGNNYGEYKNVAHTAQMLKDVVRKSASWPQMESYMHESLDMICNKMARICNGNPYYDDSWHDIGGYAKLVEDEINKGK